MSVQKYIKKQDVIDKRIVKKNGIFYKQSLLEVWYSKGLLECETSKYGGEDRLRYGLKWILDYHHLQRDNLHSGFLFNNKVDLPSKSESQGVSDAKDRYLKAVRAIPAEFWPIVRKICIEEKEPVAPPKLSERQKAYFYFMCRIDLCRGLDRIIDVYTLELKNKLNSN